MALIDPYGTDLSLTPDGDLRVTNSGSLGEVAGIDNCAQAIWLRLRTPLGDVPLHPEYGSRLVGALIGSKLSTAGLLSELNVELQTMIREDQRFKDATVVQTQQPATTGDADSIQFEVQGTLVGGEQLTLRGTDPAPIDVSLPQIVDPSIDPSITFDPIIEQEFFADQPELDDLTDLAAQQWLVENTNPNP